MYICENCEAQVGPRIGSNLVTIETRHKVYPPRGNDPGGVGREIVKEIRVCPDCVGPLSREGNGND